MAKLPTPDDVRKRILETIKKHNKDVRPGDVILTPGFGHNLTTDLEDFTDDEIKRELKRMVDDELITPAGTLTEKGFEALP